MNKLWNALYSDHIPKEQTMFECSFIEGFMPLATHPEILDLACGTGRHSLELAGRGYSVTGLDVNPKTLQVAAARGAEQGVNVKFIPADIRDLGDLDREFDGIILFWQSFGFFDDVAQFGLFADLRRKLRPGGRLIVDLYNRLHFSGRTGQRAVQENRLDPDESLPLPIWGTDRYLTTPLSYEDDLRFELQRPADLFDPHLFSPGEIAGIAANHELHLVASCSNFCHDIPATPEHPRMQLVFENGKFRRRIHA